VREVRGGTGLASFRRYTWWSLTGTDVVFLIGFGVSWIGDPALPGAMRVLAAAALAVLVAAIVVLLRLRLLRGPADGADAGLGRPPLGWLVPAGAAAVVLAAIPLALDEYGMWSLAPAVTVSTVAVFLPRRSRRILIGAAVVVAGVVGGTAGVVSGAGWLYPTAMPAGMVAFVAWATLGMLWALDLAERLDHARGLAADLAVLEERLRFAADLHDIQGHHLQVIALKSELAARLVATDPARAEAEMMQVRQLSTEALRDTRAVVAGYRRTSLDTELANAARVLAAAGIDARLDADAEQVRAAVPEPGRRLLGLVVREATTNVLRHSRARRAEVTFRVDNGTARLRFGNDGAVEPRGAASGTGLPGLADRLAAAGGSLTWARNGDRFDLAATLPVQAAQGDPR
jgi:two-component system, NarL family, sensor histidine kinase DesK